MSEYAVMPMSDYEGICDAVRAKTGGTAKLKSSEVKPAIEGIQVGGGDTDAWKPPEEYTCFYDYDGTILYQYTVEETQALTELPPLPANVNHEGLVFEGWNWSLEDLKALDYPMDVGALYNTSDGAVKVHVSVSSEDQCSITLRLSSYTNSTFTFDFGDGTEVITNSIASSGATVTHTYASVGEYVISIARSTTSDRLALNYKGSEIVTFIDQDIITRLDLSFGEIGDYALYNKQTLEFVVQSKNTLAGSSQYSYAKCSKLKYCVITDSDKVVGKYAFAGCRGLIGIALANGWSSYSGQQFNNCTSLQRICFGSATSRLNGSTLYNCYNLKRVFLPDSLSSLGTYEFENCISLNWIELPTAITSIPSGCFSKCYSLERISVASNVSSIGNSAFENCYALRLKELPSNLVSIGSRAFYQCYKLAIEVIPSTVTTIIGSVFYHCYKLKKLTFKGTPSTIHSDTFDTCYLLAEINVPWAEGEVANAPWGATNATINYNYTGEAT